jgi:hypothetical protein
MAYTYQYLNRIEQLGVINYTLKLYDDENIFPDVFIPILLNQTEDNVENLDIIANQMIQISIPVKRIEPIITDLESLSGTDFGSLSGTDFGSLSGTDFGSLSGTDFGSLSTEEVSNKEVSTKELPTEVIDNTPIN